MKRAVHRARKQRRPHRTTPKPGVTWRETDERGSDDSIVVDDRGQAQPKNYRSAQRTSRTRPWGRTTGTAGSNRPLFVV